MEGVYIVVGLLVTVLGAGLPLGWKIYRALQKDCTEIKSRQCIVETKLDIFLDYSGFDMSKVNRAIKDHLEELKQNDRPSVGCINVKTLYKDKEVRDG